MTGELSNKNAEKLNKKMDEAFKKINKILEKNPALKGDLDTQKLAESSTINNLGSLSDKTKDRMDNFSEFNAKISENINKLGPQAKPPKEYKYIQALASSIDNKRSQIISGEFGEEASLKYHKKTEQKLNKTIRNFEIKQGAKEVGNSLKEKIANIVPSPIKKLVKSKGRGE